MDSKQLVKVQIAMVHRVGPQATTRGNMESKQFVNGQSAIVSRVRPHALRGENASLSLSLSLAG